MLVFYTLLKKRYANDIEIQKNKNHNLKGQKFIIVKYSWSSTTFHIKGPTFICLHYIYILYSQWISFVIQIGKFVKSIFI